MEQHFIQRAGVLAELPGLLREMGHDASSIFAGSGIDIEKLAPDTRVPFSSLLNLLERAAGETQCPHLGTLLGLRFDFDIHGPIGQLMLSASTVHEALNDFVALQSNYSSGAIVYLNRIGDDFSFGFGCYARSAPGTRVLYDAVVAVAVVLLRELTGGKAKPTEVHLSYRLPPVTKEYARLLGTTVKFNQERSCLVLSRETLQIALPRANPAERRRLLDRFRQNAFAAPSSFAFRTRRALRSVLNMNKPSLAAVATELNMHPRTLARRLEEEGQVFSRLRDEVRIAVACELLELTDIPVGEVGEILWYASPGVFSDSFSRVKHVPPSTWRNAFKEKWAYSGQDSSA